MMPVPVSARAAATTGIGRSPAVRTCAAANRAANSTPSMTLRATSSAATAELARRTPSSDAQVVDDDAGREQPGAYRVVGRLDGNGEDAMLRAAQREKRG